LNPARGADERAISQQTSPLPSGSLSYPPPTQDPATSPKRVAVGRTVVLRLRLCPCLTPESNKQVEPSSGCRQGAISRTTDRAGRLPGARPCPGSVRRQRQDVRLPGFSGGAQNKTPALPGFSGGAQNKTLGLPYFSGAAQNKTPGPPCFQAVLIQIARLEQNSNPSFFIEEDPGKPLDYWPVVEQLEN
jgi:hypothetical protein